MDGVGIYDSLKYASSLKGLQQIEWVVKNETFVKCDEVVRRCASWKLLRGSHGSSVAPVITIITATSGRARLANGALNL